MAKSPTVPSTWYDKKYYTELIGGAKEFKKTKGKVLPNQKLYAISLAKIKPGQRILDAGCGMGDMCLYIAINYEVNVDGIDYSKEGINIAKKTLESYPPNSEKSKIHKRQYQKPPI